MDSHKQLVNARLSCKASLRLGNLALMIEVKNLDTHTAIPGEENQASRRFKLLADSRQTP